MGFVKAHSKRESGSSCAFNQEKALVGAFSVMIGKLCEGSFPALVHSSQVVEDIK